MNTRTWPRFRPLCPLVGTRCSEAYPDLAGYETMAQRVGSFTESDLIHELRPKGEY
jgi:hypothetical protein